MFVTVVAEIFPKLQQWSGMAGTKDGWWNWARPSAKGMHGLLSPITTANLAD